MVTKCRLFLSHQEAMLGQFSFSFGQEIPPEEFLEFFDGVVCAVLAVDDIARHAPAPAVFADHAVHGAIDFGLHVCYHLTNRCIVHAQDSEFRYQIDQVQ